jgi:hypothetical protein
MTGWPSLLPPSQARTPLGSPCGALSPRELYGVTKFRCRSLSGSVPAGGREVCGPRCRTFETACPPPVPFWLKPVSPVGLLPITTFIADAPLFTLPTI